MSEMKEGGVSRRGQESSKATSMAGMTKQRQEVIQAPADVASAGRWCYERLKRSTAKVRIRCPMNHVTLDTAQVQFQRFVDHVNGDTLLACAVLEHHWGQLFSTFKNGSVVEFQVGTENL